VANERHESSTLHFPHEKVKINARTVAVCRKFDGDKGLVELRVTGMAITWEPPPPLALSAGPNDPDRRPGPSDPELVRTREGG
jgi:hypothetical protein